MKLILAFVILLIPFQLTAQKLTTFILARHAEKLMDGSKDPALTPAGKIRAESLANLLGKTKIDAIFSTRFKRTEHTALPLAKAKSLSVQYYEGNRLEEVDSILAKYEGGTIVLIGHSNTTPSIANYLTGKKDELSAFEDADYGNIFVVSVIKRGDAKITRLRY